MQIIPSSHKAAGQVPFDFLASSKTRGNGGELFADLLFSSSNLGSNLDQEAFSTLPAALPDAGKAQSARQADSASRRESTLRDVKMTQEDLAGMSEKLEAAGVPKEKLEGLKKQADSPEGITWGQFMHGVREAVVQNTVGTQKLEAADKAALESLFDKLGFSREEGKSLLSALESGKASQVFQRISGKLAKMENGQTVSLGKDEMQALGKALKLNDAALSKLSGLFGGQDGLELNPAAADKFLRAALDESNAQMAALKQGLKQVKDVLEPVVQKAKERNGLARQAQEDVADARMRPSQYLADPHEAAAAKDPQRKGVQGQEPQQGQDARKQGADNHGKGNQQPGNPQSGGQQAGAKDVQGLAVAGLASKLRVEGDAGQTMDARFGLAQGLAQTQQGARGEAAAAGRTQASQVMSQVESGILRNLGQGVRQLSLELTPDSLGRLNVMLTVKGKEVQAVIKAESPQAEKVLAENLQQIKQNLENQGLTVSKLEVRMGLSQDSNLGQQWAGADKHNQSQERREALERMRTANLLAGDGEVGFLARQMQDTGVRVKNSQGGLDLVA
ncbi:hypothetical protein NNJEOMEG_00886 [Fundidesulfovibrio magnetotacticus]|uniref:Flagellar hook-length control protein-like C-terminal domain-containing protein n=1 Tax=Fundidesulfovibrio magnetotacticus TaxID=2730080 RepID=A0A6V8LTU1_9BACT|nr:flagellar hook-length control protein FliK [Fundidesulfovibrio magnetotacticus]GFK93057.1 hypothetical protein NNJEOMEG_00886 [Fundidesulfovibrio magnetotacticus]